MKQKAELRGGVTALIGMDFLFLTVHLILAARLSPFLSYLIDFHPDLDTSLSCLFRLYFS